MQHVSAVQHVSEAEDIYLSADRGCQHPETVHLPEGFYHRVCQAQKGAGSRQLHAAGTVNPKQTLSTEHV